MQDTGMAAIGKFVLWGKENLCLVRPHGDTLALETLFFGEDVRSRAEIEEAVGETDVKAPELDLAKQVIASLVGEFVPEDFENEHRRDLRVMLEAKVAGEAIIVGIIRDISERKAAEAAQRESELRLLAILDPSRDRARVIPT